jgi:TRAP-type C4-dicarboxylate transport system substrate-binding protein
MIRTLTKLMAGAALACATVAAPVLAQERLTAVHAFPASWVYSKSFIEFVQKVNTAGKGVVEIQVRGGPEAIGMFEQPAAVRNGVVDMVYTPCAFYAGNVPECDAVSASTIDGPTARKSGALAELNEAHVRRMGVYYLGWVDSGIRFHVWFKNEPKLDANGNLSLVGVKLRGNPIYNAFFTNYLKAQVINLPSTEVYTALERGTIDATGWTEIGLWPLAEFLLRAGLAAELEERGLGPDAELDAATFGTRQELKRLLDPDGMGSDLKMLVQARGALIDAARSALRLEL